MPDRTNDRTRSDHHEDGDRQVPSEGTQSLFDFASAELSFSTAHRSGPVSLGDAIGNLGIFRIDPSTNFSADINCLVSNDTPVGNSVGDAGRLGAMRRLFAASDKHGGDLDKVPGFKDALINCIETDPNESFRVAMVKELGQRPFTNDMKELLTLAVQAGSNTDAQSFSPAVTLAGIKAIENQIGEKDAVVRRTKETFEPIFAGVVQKALALSADSLSRHKFAAAAAGCGYLLTQWNSQTWRDLIPVILHDENTPPALKARACKDCSARSFFGFGLSEHTDLLRKHLEHADPAVVKGARDALTSLNPGFRREFDRTHRDMYGEVEALKVYLDARTR